MESGTPTAAPEDIGAVSETETNAVSEAGATRVPETEAAPAPEVPIVQPSADTPAPSQQTVKRREQLAVYLEQLEAARRDGIDLAAAFEGIDLGRWELQQLDQTLDSGSTGWASLLAEGVAFRSKVATDLGWADPDTQLNHSERVELSRNLAMNAAIGLALLAETQEAINQLVLVAEMETAKKLTDFRNKIAQAVKALKGRVDETAYRQAEAFSVKMVTPAAEASWTTARTRAPAAKKAKKTRGPRPAPRLPEGAIAMRVDVTEDGLDAPRDHTKLLLFVMFAVIGVWAALILPRMLREPMPVLTAQDLPTAAEFQEVVARPPSLFVTLDDRAWLALSPQDRLSLVDEVGVSAEAAGYNGAVFTLEDGSAAAQWFRERGSELAD